LINIGLTRTIVAARDDLAEEAREVTLISSSIISKIE